MQREVEEIMARQDRRPGAARLRVGKSAPAGIFSRLRLTPGVLMLGALPLLILGLALDSLNLPLVLAATALFALGYVWSMQRRSQGRRPGASGRNNPSLYWRGEPVNRWPSNPSTGSGHRVVEFKTGRPSKMRWWSGRK
jgi:hypothetical protein